MKALNEADPFGDVDTVLDVLSDMHKWEPEYAIWLANGKPLSDEYDGFTAFEHGILKAAYGEPTEEPATVAGEQDEAEAEAA